MECLPKKQQTVMEVEKKKNVVFKTYVIEMKLRPNEKREETYNSVDFIGLMQSLKLREGLLAFVNP